MARIFIRTFGCAHNQADSAAMAGLLAETGHELVDSVEEAELVLLNSCTVKEPSQSRFQHEVESAEAKGKKVVIAGCVPQGDPTHKGLVRFSALGPRSLHKVAAVVEATLKGEVVRELLRTPENPPTLLPIIRKNPLIEIIPVASGCLGHCTYCKTKHARGHLTSYPEEELVEKARRALASGAVELWLTAEDLGAYGHDTGTNIVSLANKILELPGNFKIRLGMANPPLIAAQLEELIEVLNHPKCYKFLHIPVQSGSDTILKAMRRDYTVAAFEELVTKLRSRVPGITLATDIIVGFPGETEEEFQKSMELLERHQFPVVNSSKFYARPATPAAAMEGRVATKVVKARSEQVARWYEKLDPHQALVGQEVEVIVTEKGKEKESQEAMRKVIKKRVIGHTPNYVEVLLKGEEAELGAFVTVKILSAERFYVVGEVKD